MGYRDWTAVYSDARLDATHNPQSLLLIASAESPQVQAGPAGDAQDRAVHVRGMWPEYQLSRSKRPPNGDFPHTTMRGAALSSPALITGGRYEPHITDPEKTGARNDRRRAPGRDGLSFGCAGLSQAGCKRAGD